MKFESVLLGIIHSKFWDLFKKFVQISGLLVFYKSSQNLMPVIYNCMSIF